MWFLAPFLPVRAAGGYAAPVQIMNSLSSTIQRAVAPLEPLRAKAGSRHHVAMGRAVTALKIVALPAVIIAAATVFLLQGSPSNGKAAAPLAAARPNERSVVNPLDQVASAGIARSVAQLTALPEATAVSNQADSETTQLAMSPVTSNVVAKPQIPAKTTSFASNRDIITYTVQTGDSVTSVATKYGVTSDSIRWSNNVSGDVLTPGSQILVPPVTGIVYTVKTGDTVASIASTYQADQSKIIAFNDAEISGIKEGQRILIPDGTKAAAVVVAATRPVAAATGTTWGGSANYSVAGGYNGYDYGYCTWWVAKMRAAAGNPVPTNLGNAATWGYRAAAMGIPTGSTPQVGAAVVLGTSGWGHVGYVTAVNGDGTITISEMNHLGWNVQNFRTLSAAGYQYVY